MNKNLKRMISYYKPYRKVFAADMFFAVTASGIALALPLIARYITSEVIYLEKGEALRQTLALGGFMAVLVVISCYCNFFISNYGHVMGAKIEYDMREEIFGHLQKLSFAFYDNQKVGALMSRITTDLFDITELMHHGPENIVISLIKIIGAFVIMMCISPVLTLSAFALVPVMLAYAYFFNGKMKRAFKRNREKISDINSQIEDNLSGIRVVKSFANEDIEKEKFKKGNRGFLSAKKNSYFYMGGYHAGLSSFSLLITILVLMTGAVFISSGKTEVTDLITFLLYINVLTEPIKTLIDFTEQFQNGYTGFERFVEIMSIEPDIADGEDAQEMSDIMGTVDFDNVSFRYEENSGKVLSHIHLHVDAGEYVALVGSSGAGKSTLCSLIPRFYDVTGGAVKIDGRDIRTWKLKSLREQIGIVQQDVYLFVGTVYDNIHYGRPDASREEVVEAAKNANAHEFIMSLPNGYETDIGQRGIKLSGGQKQRISIARALMKDAPILILDDSVSAVDTKTEAAILENLREARQGKTTILIAHRVTTIEKMDKILFVEDGELVAAGPHEELYETCPEYRKMVDLQKLEEEGDVRNE